LLELFKHKPSCRLCLYIMSIQRQHYSTWQGCSTRSLAVSNHTFDQNWVARALPFLESLSQFWHILVTILHFPEGRPVFVEAAWDY